MINLNNRVVVITGSAMGLGRALASECYRQGCNLALIDIDLPALEQVRNIIENGKQKITIHQADISREEEVINVRDQVMAEHKRVDVLINNAGISVSQPFDQIALADFKRLMDINFWGTIYCSRYFLPALKHQNESRLVNILSDFALMGFPAKTAYSASKGAVLGFTNSLKTELEGTSVKICMVIPPPLDTGLIINSKHIDDDKRRREAEFLRKKGMNLNEAAGRIIEKVKTGRYRIIIGRLMFWVDLASRFFPTTIHNFLGRNKNRIDFV